MDWEAYLAAHEPSPELRAMFDKVDAFLAGLTKAEQLAAVNAMYFDGDGEIRRRDQLLRVVRNEEIIEPEVETGRGDEINEVVDLVRERELRRRRRRGLPPPD